MLTLTPTAAEVVRTLVEQSTAPDSGGLRIAAGEETGEGIALELSLVEEPEMRSPTEKLQRSEPERASYA